MMKLYIVLAIALVIESFGNIYLSKGMKEVGEVSLTSVTALTTAVRCTVTNPNLLLGVGLLAVFFGLFLVMLSWGDISVVLPLTSIGYLLTAVLAKWMLHENVNPWRWLGTLLIIVGVYFVMKSNQAPALQPARHGPPIPSINS